MCAYSERQDRPLLVGRQGQHGHIHDVPTFASTFAQHLLMQMLGPFERADSNTFTFQEQSELKYEFGSKEGKRNVGLGYKGNTTQRKIKKCCYLSDFSVWGI